MDTNSITMAIVNVSLINVAQTFQFAPELLQTESSCYNSRLLDTKMAGVNATETINHTDVIVT